MNQKYRMLRAGFSDFGSTIEDLFSAGDRVAARVTVRGTHDGEFMGRPATGAEFRGDLGRDPPDRRRPGDRAPGHRDRLGMLTQLGILPDIG